MIMAQGSSLNIVSVMNPHQDLVRAIYDSPQRNASNHMHFPF